MGVYRNRGGWNRIVLEVDDLSECIDELKRQGVHFLNEIESGPGGRQVQLEDLDGNSIELLELARTASSALEVSP